MSNKIKGKKAEALTARHLENLGWEITERNYRSGRSEIDIIAIEKNELLVFVEVKYRQNLSYGLPEETISRHQIEKIKTGAVEYMAAINWQKDIRFDIVAIDKNLTITHLKDAFF